MGISYLVEVGNYELTLHAIPFLVSGILDIFLGVFVYLHNLRSKVNLSFLFVCLATSIWLLAQSLTFLSNTPQVALFWERVTYIGVTLVPVAVYHFSLMWLGGNKWKGLLRDLGFWLALAFILVIFFTPLIVGKIQRLKWGYYSYFSEPGGTIYVGFFAFYTFAFFQNLVSAYRKENSGIKRNQIRLVIIAFFVAFTGAVDFLPCYGIDTYPVGYAPILFFVLANGLCIIRYRLMDIQTVIHKTIMWGLTSLIFAVPVVIFAYIGKDWLISLHPALFSGVVFSMGVLFILYARLAQPKIDHVFQRKRWDLARVFEKFTDELVHLRNLDELSSHILETVKNVFYVDEISLLLSKDETSPFECVRSVPAEKSFSFGRTNVFLNWLEKNDMLVLREYLEIDPKYTGIKKSAEDYFETVNAQVCVPLIVSQRLLGIINIGQKANLKKFGTAEINFLSDLRKTAAIALSNSLRSIAMQESLRRWNVELEKKVDERTKELKDTQAQLIQAEKLASIGTLAGGVAHEINNPLTAVLTNVQMLKMAGEVKDTESLSLIEEGAKRCQVIIQKLMRYARKTEEVEKHEQVDLNKVIRSVSEFLGYQLKQENIELSLSLGQLDPIPGIANELEQVFTNLILNSRDAVKAAARRGKIEIKTEQKNGSVKIEVIDNGIGIKKEYLARVFDPFYTTKDVGEGTGLGLTVSSGIVEKHLGKISVSSEEGRGTMFTIRFPIGKEKASADKK